MLVPRPGAEGRVRKLIRRRVSDCSTRKKQILCSGFGRNLAPQLLRNITDGCGQRSNFRAVTGIQQRSRNLTWVDVASKVPAAANSRARARRERPAPRRRLIQEHAHAIQAHPVVATPVVHVVLVVQPAHLGVCAHWYLLQECHPLDIRRVARLVIVEVEAESRLPRLLFWV